MSNLLQANKIGHSVAGRELFRGLDLAVARGDRIGLVGHNGAGKTTLLDLLEGVVEPDSGVITRLRGLTVGRVAQFLPPELASLPMLEVVAQQVPAQESWRAQSVLAELGIDESHFAVRAEALSGGQVNRLLLARALVSRPELLLLDEPTNHLDLATLNLFEGALASFSGAIVLVSHDRAFLDGLSTSTVYLRDQRAYRFELTFSASREELARMDVAAAEKRAAEEKEIDKLRASAKRLAHWGRTYDNEDLARRARNMHRRVDRLEEEKTFVSRGSGLALGLQTAATRGNRALSLDAVDVSAGARELFRIDEAFVRPGERVALLGHNGVGKTTLIRRLLAAVEHPDDRVRFNPQVRLGYYDQELQATSGATPLARFVGADLELSEQAVTRALVAAGFPFDRHESRVGSMSGGERARALFVRLSLERCNFLILDEPTNHIDIDGREQLEAQLLASDATLLFTSHDREFVNRLAERFWLIEGGALREVYDPRPFFTSTAAASGERARRGANDSGGRAADAGSATATSEEDELLERIDTLERLLAADRARKPKFQKPARQAEWQEELDALLGRLE
ncbi:MAG: ABC-F family ATP-binding cassette domain-containing protein [Pseudomonadota bacterium]